MTTRQAFIDRVWHYVRRLHGKPEPITALQCWVTARACRRQMRLWAVDWARYRKCQDPALQAWADACKLRAVAMARASLFWLDKANELSTREVQ